MTKTFNDMLQEINESYCSTVPPTRDTHAFMDDLVHLLFPIMENRSLGLDEINVGFAKMQLRLKELLIPLASKMEQKPDVIAEFLFERIPEVYEKLSNDAQTILDSDPAARCLEEVITCYPGFLALIFHRLAHILYTEGVPLLPRVISEYAHTKTGIDIHPGASIGNNFYIDHGTGIVIGETAIIGNNVKLYQGVTIGARFVEKRLKDTKRHPTIEDNVIIYAGSTILGGFTIIGHDTIIGGNAWLTESVPPHSVVYREHQTVVRANQGTKI